MSRVTDQLDRIEAILKNDLIKNRLTELSDGSFLEAVKDDLQVTSDRQSQLGKDLGTDFRCLMTKLENIEKKIDAQVFLNSDSDDDCTICGLEEALKEKEEELTAQEEIIDNNIDYIHFLENELTIQAEENKKLRKKNKKLKKRIKTLQEVIAEDEDAL